MVSLKVEFLDGGTIIMAVNYSGGLVRFVGGLPSEIGPNNYSVTLNGIKAQIGEIISERNLLRSPMTVTIGDVKRSVNMDRFVFDSSLEDVDRFEYDPFNNPNGLTLALILAGNRRSSKFFEFDIASASMWYDLLKSPWYWGEVGA